MQYLREYIYKGRKATVEGEDYHGIMILRFYIKWYVTLELVLRGILTFRVVPYVLPKSHSRRIQRTQTMPRNMAPPVISSHGGKSKP
jgi:hypothetical protein